MTESCSGNCGQLCEIVVNPTPNCNLRCDYCYDGWRDRKHIVKMDPDVWDGIRKLTEYTNKENLTFAFLGGEAAILGVEYFEEFEEYWGDIKHKSHLQTNATLLDDEFCAFLKKHDYTVGTSLDGVPEIHNRTRDNSFSDTLRGITLAKEYGILNKILCTITNRSMQHLEETFELFAIIGAPTHFNAGSPDLLPRNYHLAMRTLYELWHDFGRPFYGLQFTRIADRIEQKRWQDITRGKLCTCMQNAVQIDYDGSVAMCSQLSGNKDYIIGNVKTDHPIKILTHPNRWRFWNGTKEIQEGCHKCQFRFLCIGGCYFNALSHNKMRDPYCGGGAGMYKAALGRAGMTVEYMEFVHEQNSVRVPSAESNVGNQPVRLKPQVPNVRLRQHSDHTGGGR